MNLNQARSMLTFSGEGRFGSNCKVHTQKAKKNEKELKRGRLFRRDDVPICPSRGYRPDLNQALHKI